MRKRARVIYNPTSGREALRSDLVDILSIYEQAGYETSAFATTPAPNSAKNEARRAAEEGFDLIVAAGGDGTLNEVVNGIAGLEHRPTMAIIPAGTTNDFANSIGIPKPMEQAAKLVVEGEPFACDIGRFNDSYFVYVAAFGLITDVSYTTDIEKKHKYGRLAYYLEALKRLKKIPTYRIKLKYDEKHIEDEFIYGGITNSESIAGFKWFERGEILLDDGEFEGIFIRKPKNIFGYIKILSSFIRKEYSENEYILSTRAKKYEIQSEENIAWTIDGEFAGDFKDVTINNEKRAIEFAVYEEENKKY